jgi:hypothetical protein
MIEEEILVEKGNLRELNFSERSQTFKEEKKSRVEA